MGYSPGNSLGIPVTDGGWVRLWLSWKGSHGMLVDPTPPFLSVEGISVKMFLRGRPITMYIPSGIRSLEELPSGPPPETLSLDWVYPAPCSPMGTTLPVPGLPPPTPPRPPFFMVFSWVCRESQPPAPSLPSFADGAGSQSSVLLPLSSSCP